MPKYTVVEGLLRELDSDNKTLLLWDNEEGKGVRHDLLPEISQEAGWEEKIIFFLSKEVRIILKDGKVYEVALE
jgi:hypothetical protein